MRLIYRYINFLLKFQNIIKNNLLNKNCWTNIPVHPVDFGNRNNQIFELGIYVSLSEKTIRDETNQDETSPILPERLETKFIFRDKTNEISQKNWVKTTKCTNFQGCNRPNWPGYHHMLKHSVRHPADVLYYFAFLLIWIDWSP